MNQNTQNTETQNTETKRTVRVGKAAPVGKTVAIHTFEILERVGNSRTLNPVETVYYITNVGEGGKDNRDIADKAVRKAYPKAVVDYIDTTTQRMEITFGAFVSAALSAGKAQG